MKLYTNGSREIDTRLINNHIYYIKHMTEEEIMAEVVASRIGQLLGFDVVHNTQIELSTVYSRQYQLDINETKIPIGDINRLLTISDKLKQQIFNMFIFDYIIINVDRHIKNIELLYNTNTNTYRISSLYDFNLSLLSTISDKNLTVQNETYDPLTQNFNNKSLLENIEAVTKAKYKKNVLTPHLNINDFKDLFTDNQWNDTFINTRLDTIINIVNNRLSYLFKLNIVICNENRGKALWIQNKVI